MQRGLRSTSLYSIKSRVVGRRNLLVVAGLAVLAVLAAACGGGGNATGGSTASTTTGVSQVTTLLNQGLAAQKAGDLATAIGDYNQILAQQPANQYALYDLGLAEQLQNDTTDAATHCRAALAVNPNFAPALFNLAIVVTPTAPTEAADLYQQVLTLQPNNASAHLNLGYVDLTLGKRPAAIAQFKSAVALSAAMKTRVPSEVKVAVLGAGAAG